MQTVTFFKEVPLEIGQKINLSGGSRRGDWIVTGFDGRKMRLKCPISGKEVEWDRFFALVEQREVKEWPTRD